MSDQQCQGRRESKLEELRRFFRDGIESGPHIAADEVFAELTSRYAELIRKTQA
jgi:hypothetical protein